jgi:hypothetical protein
VNIDSTSFAKSIGAVDVEGCPELDGEGLQLRGQQFPPGAPVRDAGVGVRPVVDGGGDTVGHPPIRDGVGV